MEELQETQECRNAAQRSCDLLFNMIQDLLDISKMEDGQLNLNLENFSVLEILNTVAKEFKHPSRAEDKEIVVAVPADLPLFQGIEIYSTGHCLIS